MLRLSLSVVSKYLFYSCRVWLCKKSELKKFQKLLSLPSLLSVFIRLFLILFAVLILIYTHHIHIRALSWLNLQPGSGIKAGGSIFFAQSKDLVKGSRGILRR